MPQNFLVLDAQAQAPPTFRPLIDSRARPVPCRNIFTSPPLIGIHVLLSLLNNMHATRLIRPSLHPARLRSPQLSRTQAPSTLRKLHLAPPFLLDDYIPRYHLLSSVDASKKRSAAYAHLRNCNLCPRLCGVNRYEKTGTCLIGAETVKVNTIAPHFGEEPCIQGHNGSGSVFFSGCNLRCVFCQNHDIAHQRNGQDLTPEELGEWYIKLQDVGRVHNINLITPEVKSYLV
jgi:putative pyruvate formate lyase activating enzyme